MKVPVNVDCIDQLLGGGFEAGAVTEIYGEAGSGKTNMCLQLAKAVIQSGKKAVYIDSEGLSRDRIQQIFGDQYDSMIKDLLIFEPYDFEEQDKIVKKAVNLALKNDDIGLVILDSATGHYRIELAKDLEKTERKSFIGQITGLLRLCRRRVIPVLLTSQVYTDIDKGVLRPLGGHVLRHNAKVIIHLVKDEDIPGRRIAVLMKHRSLAEGERAEFWLTRNGLECR
ncbi:MAG: DNA repair and recombination protein RadB [Thermoplasmata archaeon]|nr:DNA repair and recombination protein RadB [Thermoplasmata archaeon]